MTRSAAAALLFPAFFLTSCASDDEPKPIDKTGTMLPTKLVGRVASIPADRKFILIQSYGQWTVPAGSILTTEGPESRTANLLVTGEVSGQYAAADIQSGVLEVGDAVYSRTIPKPVEPPAAPHDLSAP